MNGSLSAQEIALRGITILGSGKYEVKHTQTSQRVTWVTYGHTFLTEPVHIFIGEKRSIYLQPCKELSDCGPN